MANNGQEAIELASAGHFDLVLMDMQMPVMNGIEATRRLRESGYEQPIYALTANMMPQHYQEFEAAGCSGFLGKPIDRIELRRTLMQHLQKVVEE
jgi:CheY-like chemotaxis protein